MHDKLEHSYAPAGVSTSDAAKVGAVLQERLASLIDLSLTLKHVHWDVIGPGFMSMVDELDPITGDLLIEQSRQLEMQHWFIRAHLSDTSGHLVTESTLTEMDGAIAAVYALQPGIDGTSDGAFSEGNARHNG
jgi:hypothetical protein